MSDGRAGIWRRERLAAWLSSASGLLLPLAAAVLAFFVGGIVVVATGHNPFSAYAAIFRGSGFNWFFPWLSGAERASAAINLQQNLLVATPLILTALAVAFAFRAGMFNIGGNGQYIVGLVASVYVGSHLAGLTRPLHVLVAVLAALVGGAVWGGVAGVLKATVGAHEVISTIMLNFIALFVGMYLFELGGPLQGPEPSIPRSDEVAESARL